MTPVPSSRIARAAVSILKFPEARVCKHHVGCVLLQVLADSGVNRPDGLAAAVVGGDDNRAVELLKTLTQEIDQ